MGTPAIMAFRGRNPSRQVPQRAVIGEPNGGPLIIAPALGLVAFGVYCLFDGWYRKA